MWFTCLTSVSSGLIQAAVTWLWLNTLSSVQAGKHTWLCWQTTNKQLHCCSFRWKSKKNSELQQEFIFSFWLFFWYIVFHKFHHSVFYLNLIWHNKDSKMIKSVQDFWFLKKTKSKKKDMILKSNLQNQILLICLIMFNHVFFPIVWITKLMLCFDKISQNVCNFINSKILQRKTVCFFHLLSLKMYSMSSAVYVHPG